MVLFSIVICHQKDVTNNLESITQLTKIEFNGVWWRLLVLDGFYFYLMEFVVLAGVYFYLMEFVVLAGVYFYLMEFVVLAGVYFYLMEFVVLEFIYIWWSLLC